MVAASTITAITPSRIGQVVRSCDPRPSGPPDRFEQEHAKWSGRTVSHKVARHGVTGQSPKQTSLSIHSRVKECDGPPQLKTRMGEPSRGTRGAATAFTSFRHSPKELQ